ncbi:argininosuccinate lyase [Parolsenella catena]|uniref:Argininosuccinate lyase n=1 Tax=Parolsenella catena TaxID=2003188 RepID=A0A3G9JWD7_9ACTN|nr:argininosuccinate lyase [Parolsenella catena]BBH49738.1 argininosuccinate lyase [Parolsenella catena]
MSDNNATPKTAADAPKPLWAGRFSAAPTGELERFGASLPFDKRMWRQDIRGSKAHAAMLAHQGVISQQDADAIRAGLDDIAGQIERGEFTFDVDRDEDIHMAIERVLTENIGPAGGRLHTGRSRNDQTAVDTHLIARDLADEILASLAKLEAVLLDRAQGEFGVVMPGYTHMQPAQPVLLSHHLLAYFWMFNRDFRRVSAAREAANVCPLGAAALAGTTYPLDRHMTAEALGFSGPTANSMDSVSDRDYLLDLIYACSVCQVHLSRLCEELVWWSSAEFGFVEMDDAHSTGSSIMPQKKNPDFAELVRGKSGRVVGDLTSLLVTVKGTPLTYDKDLQEDKEPLFDAADTVLGSLMACTGMLATCTFKEERMREASHEGYMAATDLADYLVGKGLPFRQAHAVVGRIVGDCVREGVTLQQLSTDELRSYSELFDDDAHEALDIDSIVRRRTTFGGTGHEAVRAQLKLATEALEADEAALGE